MEEQNSFQNLIQRIRGGDPLAAEELCRLYEPLLQREMRLRLRDPRLRRRFDEQDVCQSVMASFFIRVRAGQFNLENPDQLRALLAQMGRNKLASQARLHGSERRDYRRVGELPEDSRVAAQAKSEGTPSQIVSLRELFERFRDQLTEEERQITDLRSLGKGWAEIAEILGGSPDARRIQLNRAIERVSQELGLDSTESD